MAEKGKIKSLLTEEEKEVYCRYKRCKDCPELEKYYYDGICYYVYFRETKVSKEVFEIEHMAAKKKEQEHKSNEKCCISCQYLYKLYDAYCCRTGIIENPYIDCCMFYREKERESNENRC